MNRNVCDSRAHHYKAVHSLEEVAECIVLPLRQALARLGIAQESINRFLEVFHIQTDRIVGLRPACATILFADSESA